MVFIHLVTAAFLLAALAMAYWWRPRSDSARDINLGDNSSGAVG
jgi:hypothetical protein